LAKVTAAQRLLIVHITHQCFQARLVDPGAHLHQVMGEASGGQSREEDLHEFQLFRTWHFAQQ
jgi:hypothetical protein